jgi:hypothetical protein
MDEGGRNRPGGLTPLQLYDDDEDFDSYNTLLIDYVYHIEP